ncbi:hypothetical protein ZIOFF_068694 [Zingiber officinale]|uniref:ADP,ATP carrier protein n=1 Tax=Zingiber officinale TaxID=94328 RepID=A0A8J5ETF8_ZINOF|nr:hypothetical protein ZIOFF_068694 [Zingiber officinale]
MTFMAFEDDKEVSSEEDSSNEEESSDESSSSDDDEVKESPKVEFLYKTIARLKNAFVKSQSKGGGCEGAFSITIAGKAEVGEPAAEHIPCGGAVFVFTAVEEAWDCWRACGAKIREPDASDGRTGTRGGRGREEGAWVGIVGQRPSIMCVVRLSFCFLLPAVGSPDATRRHGGSPRPYSCLLHRPASSPQHQGMQFHGLYQITTVEEAKEFYPLFGLGANIALIFSGRTVKYFSNLRVNKFVVNDPSLPRSNRKKKVKKPKLGMNESLKVLLSSRYVRDLATLVVAYGISINLVEVTWKSKLKAQVKQNMTDKTHQLLDARSKGRYHVTSQLSSKSDVYSFGVVILELVTGQAPICIDTALGCPARAAQARPTMGNVVAQLKSSLELENLRIKNGNSVASSQSMFTSSY